MTLFIFAVILTAASVRAEIIEIRSITEVSQYVNDDTLVIFELDNVIFEAKNENCHLNRYLEQIESLKNLPENLFSSAKEVAFQLWERSQNSCDVEFVEKEVKTVLKELQDKGIHVMALTSRGADIQSETLSRLGLLGISFGETALSKSTLEFGMQFQNKAVFATGILFASQHNSKASVLLQYFREVRKQPKQMVFVDHQKERLTNIESSFPKITVTGLHYSLIEKRQIPKNDDL